jgi:hypothetical protein
VKVNNEARGLRRNHSLFRAGDDAPLNASPVKASPGRLSDRGRGIPDPFGLSPAKLPPMWKGEDAEAKNEEKDPDVWDPPTPLKQDGKRKHGGWGAKPPAVRGQQAPPWQKR